jgi:L-2-hydroxyglutarate oxidase LhgO
MQVLVVGAGVVGLAIARAAALRGHDVIVAEATGGIGNGVSSRNSEVIHGGIYYPTGSLRARHSTRGRRMLYEFCASHGVAHNNCGKLIVATDAAELVKVEALLAQGQKNDVEGLELIGGNAARALEAELACVGALLSPESGIIDSHGYMLALWGELEDRGGSIAFETPVERISFAAPHWQVQFGGRDAGTASFDAVVNSAGLNAQALARRIDGYPPGKVPPLILAKGNYFAFAGKPVFSRLIYPTPVDGGLGVHVTLDMAGRMRFGPDVEWIDHESYTVDPRRAEVFYARIRSYWPALPDGSLVPDYCGIRPKLSGPGQAQADFMIAGEAAHGLPRLVCLFGIESPGLTASLSLAEAVVDYLSA